MCFCSDQSRRPSCARQARPVSEHPIPSTPTRKVSRWRRVVRLSYIIDPLCRVKYQAGRFPVRQLQARVSGAHLDAASPAGSDRVVTTRAPPNLFSERVTSYLGGPLLLPAVWSAVDDARSGRPAAATLIVSQAIFNFTPSRPCLKACWSLPHLWKLVLPCSSTWPVEASCWEEQVTSGSERTLPQPTHKPGSHPSPPLSVGEETGIAGKHGLSTVMSRHLPTYL